MSHPVHEEKREIRAFSTREKSAILFLLIFTVVAVPFTNWFFSPPAGRIDWTDPPKPESDVTNSSSLTIGDTAYVRAEGLESVHVGTSAAAEDRLSQLFLANDNQGILELKLQGQVVSVQRNTQRRLIEQSWSGTWEARVLEEQHKGILIYLPREYLHADRS